MPMNPETEPLDNKQSQPRPEKRAETPERLRMARIGAGLQLLKIQSGAELDNVRSYPDRVIFDFEDVPYVIVRVDLLQQPASERCGECGHDEGTDPRGRCVKVERDPGGSAVYCGCKCEFAATGAPDYRERNGEALSRFRGFERGWDSYNGSPIHAQAIEIAQRLIPVLPEWHVVPCSDGSIQFDGPNDHEIHVDVVSATTSVGEGGERQCDYRHSDCAATGSAVDGKWICDNHKGRVSDTLSGGGRPAANPEHEGGTSKTSGRPLRPAPVAAEEAQNDGWVTFGRVKSDIENETETFERIHPPQPSTTTTSDAASEAAREIDAELEIHPPLSQRRLERIAAVISAHLDAGEVERLRKLLAEEKEWGREHEASMLASVKAQGEWIDQLRAELETAQGAIKLWEQSYAEQVKQTIGVGVQARANVIRDAVDKVYPIMVTHYDECTNSVRAQQLHYKLVTTLQSLLDQKEGD